MRSSTSRVAPPTGNRSARAPRSSCGRPSTAAAPSTSPAASSSRTRVEENGTEPGCGATRPRPEHLETEIGTHLLEQRDVSTPLVPEVEVGADHHEARVQQADEHLVHEVFGALAAAGLVEREHETEVEQTGLVEQLEPVLQRREELRRGAGPHDLRGMAVERDQRRAQATRVGELAHETQHRAVAEVHTVERADGDDRAGAGVVAGGRARIADDLHASPPASTTAALQRGALALVDREQRAVVVDHRERSHDLASRREGQPAAKTAPWLTARASSPDDGRRAAAPASRRRA